MDIIIIAVGIILLSIGFMGILFPVLPSIMSSYLALLLIHFTGIHPFKNSSLVVLLLITIFIHFIDYFLPIWGAKKYGGTKLGIWGAVIGGLISMFIAPFFGLFGIIIIFLTTYSGAYIGEFIAQKEHTLALKAANGAMLGLFFASIVKFVIALLFALIFLYCILCYFNIDLICSKIVFL